MATSRDDMQDKTLTFRKFKDGDHEWGSMTAQIFSEDTSYKCPTYVNRTPSGPGRKARRLRVPGAPCGGPADPRYPLGFLCFS